MRGGIYKARQWALDAMDNYHKMDVAVAIVQLLCQVFYINMMKGSLCEQHNSLILYDNNVYICENFNKILNMINVNLNTMLIKKYYY